MFSNREAQNLDNWITGHYGEDQFRGLSDIFCANCPHEHECGKDVYCNSEEEKKTYLRSIQEANFDDDPNYPIIPEATIKGKFIYECPTHGRFFYDIEGLELGCDYCGFILLSLVCYCENCETRTSVRSISIYNPRCIRCDKEVKVFKEEVSLAMFLLEDKER